MTDQPKVTALIMAGKRSGIHDPLAARAGTSQKCVVPIDGKPLIEHTLAAVAASDKIGEIRIVAHETADIEAIPLVANLVAQGRVRFVKAAVNLVDSVPAGAEGAAFPIMLTTADNVLVTSEGYDEFIDGCFASNAGAAAALAREEQVKKADQRGQLKFYRFKDGGFSNCNTYWIGHQSALNAAEIFRGGGQFVKKPHRIAKAFGILNLARFYFGNADRHWLFEKLSKRFGFEMRTVIVSDGQFAIDVDDFRTYDIAEALLKKRPQNQAN